MQSTSASIGYMTKLNIVVLQGILYALVTTYYSYTCFCLIKGHQYLEITEGSPADIGNTLQTHDLINFYIRINVRAPLSLGHQ